MLQYIVRLGADKWAHFFSGGGSYYNFYVRALEQKIDRAAAELLVIDRGISRGDLPGLRLVGRPVGGRPRGELPRDDVPARALRGRGAATAARRRSLRVGAPVRRPRLRDGRVGTSPDNNSGFVRQRWKKVKPRMRELCPLLDDPWVLGQRARYAERDFQTPTRNGSPSCSSRRTERRRALLARRAVRGTEPLNRAIMGACLRSSISPSLRPAPRAGRRDATEAPDPPGRRR